MGSQEQRDGRSQRRLTRRHFLLMTSAAAATAVMSACSTESSLPTPSNAGVPSTAPSAAGVPTTTVGAPTVAAGGTARATVAAPAGSATARTGTASPASGGPAVAPKGEAPALAEAVKAGRLPALAERLPKNPIVITPVERVGKYGGQWRSALLGGADVLWLNRTIGYENLVRWDPEWKGVVPNVAESWTASADAKEYTFQLREGLRWSDGQPFTADDILFWYEDVQLNKDLTPSRGVNPPVVEKVNATTVRFRFEQPNGLFLTTLAGQDGLNITTHPKHYLQQFHIKYNPQGVEGLAKESGVDGWVRLFQTKGGSIPGTPYQAIWQNKDLPRLHGWLLTTAYGTGNRVVAERNPYYWKIDTAGNQLPYIDRANFEVFQDAQTLVLRAANGEIDMQDRNLNADSNKAVFAENQQKGGYRFFDSVPAVMNTNTIALNLTHKDPVKRQIYSNKDFRIGLSHAINRQEIIDVVYVSQGEPWQSAPRRESEFYTEKMAKQYTEYDLAKANASLDKAFPQKNAQGLRLGPNGQPIGVQIEVSTATPVQVDTMNLVARYWKAVGIDTQVKGVDRALFDTRRSANEHDAVVWLGAGGIDVILNPPYYFPWSSRADYAQPWYVWYAKPANATTAAEEPPASTKEQMNLYRQLSETADQAKQGELMRRILTIAADEFYTIGISLPANGYGIVKNNFRNVPKAIPDANTYPNPAPTNPCQYFIE